jgi:cytidylate kinase/pantoate ligase/cytidylate kinase
MIITLDGPAGAGKSSVARRLAQRLGFRFLDTGAMYRAVALAAQRRGIAWDDAKAMAELARSIRIELADGRVFLDGRDVTDEIRTTAVTSVVHHVADNPGVRSELVRLQRKAAEGQNIVTEGRDQGTVALPDAGVKIFLTASPEERARRRQRELTSRGENVPFEVLLAQQNERDRRDATRPVGRLEKAPDAVEVVTDGQSLEQVVDRLEQIVRARQRK